MNPILFIFSRVSLESALNQTIYDIFTKQYSNIGYVKLIKKKKKKQDEGTELCNRFSKILNLKKIKANLILKKKIIILTLKILFFAWELKIERKKNEVIKNFINLLIEKKIFFFKNNC